MREIEIFGVPICIGSREALLALARERLLSGGAIATVNATMLERARRDRIFRHTLTKMTCIPDGVGVRVLLSYFGVRTDVLPGVELLEEILADGRHRVALIGGHVGVAEAAGAYLMRHNPELDIALMHDGYSDFSGILAEKLHTLDAVCLALGSPKQELLAYRLAVRCAGLFTIGLGGTLDVYSGRVRRAPRFFRALGLEWMWRMLREPRRLCGVGDLLRFMIFGIVSHPIAPKTVEKSSDT